MKVYSKCGKVYLLGAGPGDPELITVKGARCLKEANVVIHDRLIDPRLLDMANPSAERILVGKKGGHYTVPQETINQLLVKHAREGKIVVRLKGGDPFLFGRGGEEALFLKNEGVPFEVIPGITSVSAVPAAAGIPLTHRGLSSSIAILTGHQCANTEHPLRWDLLAQAADTLVVLMPLRNLRQIVSQLVLHGRSLDTPAALIQAGTSPSQQRVVSTLKNLVADAARAGIDSPALLVIGEVVRLSETLSQITHAVSAHPSLRSVIGD
ncbi:MAG: uroporphyrinogen-III C-methyltransferase [Acidobacteria bacterium]|nr:uroporphyrinogen-III C-methyltransferase [Acidobacteriota bacterium]